MDNRHTRWAAVIGLLGASLLVVPAAPTATGQEIGSLPNTFGLRLEGYAVETNTFSTATAVTPRSAYSYAKISSSLDLDGGRGLDMEARGANDQYAGLEGAVIFSGDTPTDGNNLPGYTQAFFPTFEGFETVSEKCALNQTEAKETPECRDQDGPYALAQVVPDQAAPSAVGIGRNQGSDDGKGDARSSSEITPNDDDTILGVQSNKGTDQGVPGTPITVESYVAEQTVTATLDGATADVRCAGEVSVAGQPVNDNEALQEALAPLTVGSDLRVTFEPPTEPVVTELPGGALESSCRGPKFTVFNGAQGGSGTTYTFGRTFAAVGITENRDASFGGGDIGGGSFPPPDTGGVTPPASGSGGGESSFPTPGSDLGSGGSDLSSSPPAAEQPSPSTTAPVDLGGTESASSPELVRRTIDTMPLGALTFASAALLSMAVWLLLGVTGSLARGLPGLRLPPFRD